MFGDDLAETEALWTSIVDRTTRLLGPDHQQTLNARQQLATVIHDARRAYAELTAVCPRLNALGRRQECAFDRAWLAEALGDRPAALAAMREADGDGVMRDETTIAAAFIAVAEHRPDADRQLAALRAAADEPSGAVWADMMRVRQRVLLAWAADQRATPAVATAAWAAVLAIDVRAPAMVQRQLAQARATLAERWADRQPARARQLAIDALAWYRDSPSDAALVARLERIAAAR